MGTVLYLFSVFSTYGQQNLFLEDLSGEWQAKIGDSPQWVSESLDESDWTPITLPGANFLKTHEKQLFKNENPKVKTFIWFRKTITLEQLPRDLVYLQIGEIQNADEVFLNGIRVGSTGNFPPNFHSGWRNFRNYSIDPQLFKLGKNTIALRVFCDVENWITGPLLITNNPDSNFQKMIRDLLQINIFEYFFILLISVAAYFLIYFFMRRKESAYLYFSLTCISMAFILFTWFYDIRYPFLPIPSNHIYALCQSALFFLSPLLSLFVFTYLNESPNRMRKVLSLTGPFVGSALLLFSMERSWLLDVRSIFMILQPIFFTVIYIDVYRAVKKRKPHSIKMLFSVVPLTLFSVRDILSFIFGIGTDGSVYFVYGMPPIFFLFAIQFIQQFVSNLNQTEVLKASFYRFVPVEFLKIIGRTNISEVRLGDSMHRKLALLFTDICQFSSISEKMEPKDVFKLLNSYLSYMVPIIQQHKGFVDKYIGDAIMALFPESPNDALVAAIALRRALKKFNEGQAQIGGIEIACGTGLHFGELILGTIGDEARMEGTVVADSVNLASRIESLTRYYGCDVLISGSMITLVTLPEGCNIRFVDRVVVAGRNASEDLYELLWDTEDPSIKPRVKSLIVFEKAIGAYFQNNIAAAKKLFKKILAGDASDTVTQVYINRIELIEQNKMQWCDHTVFYQK